MFLTFDALSFVFENREIALELMQHSGNVCIIKDSLPSAYRVKPKLTLCLSVAPRAPNNGLQTPLCPSIPFPKPSYEHNWTASGLRHRGCSTPPMFMP